MINIAHRGLFNGPNKKKENNLEQIKSAIKNGYEVEIDLRLIQDRLYLGHDEIQETLELKWLNDHKNKLWIHCKNIFTVDFFYELNLGFNYFFHNIDHLTITSKNYLWVYPKKPYTKNSIVVCNTKDEIDDVLNSTIKPLGICSDFSFYVHELINN